MVKKIALGLATASFALGGVASAREVRPAAVSLPATAQTAMALPAPAKASVAKKNKAAGGFLVPALAALAVVGLIVIVASDDSSPN